MGKIISRGLPLFLGGWILLQILVSPALAQDVKGSLFLQIRRTLPAVLVNGATITRGQIEDRMNRMKRRDFLSSTKVVENLTPAGTRVLATDLMIEEYVALQLAANHNIHVTTEEVERSLHGIVMEAGEMAAFEETLHKHGLINEGLMSEGLKNLYIDKLRRNYASTLPTPTMEEMREFYETNRIVFQATPERVLARQIFLVKPKEVKNLSEEDLKIQARAMELIERIKQGEDFKELADRYTEDPNGIGTGGSLGWVMPGLGNSLLEPHIFKMKPGEILDEPVRVAGGYSIPTIDKHEEAVFVPFDEAKPRVIKGWQIEKFREWLEEEKKNSDIQYFENLPQRAVMEGKKPKITEKIY